MLLDGRELAAHVAQLGPQVVLAACGQAAVGACGGGALVSAAERRKALARVPEMTPRVATPVSMRNTAAVRPFLVSGTMSPYPTVVSVTMPHHRESPKVANSGLTGCSAT